MPTSTKQLEQRYTIACENIQDAKDYIQTQLFLNIEFNVEGFYESLPTANLDEYEVNFRKMEEAKNLCERSIRSERSRRQFALQIEARKNEEKQKDERMRVHKEERRQKRLSIASPYQRGNINQP
ncbi:hypothetical protein OS493_022013 [Desmophyllum pertusum]|uniref:Uncharacterized protein n=1 Tax=Desmophyllum pertusum TaxID=174260 RepID=A0A9W9YYW9_9CNID|nr:hypothetical protein OS493_022013 [Desmophyllum pertusum]